MFRNLIIPQASSSMPPRIPPPSHRHGAPSGPWPFLDIDDEVDPTRIEDPDSHLPMSARACDHAVAPGQDLCWCKYPQAFFPNWTERQQHKSRISHVVATDKSNCTIRYLDVMDDGTFVDAGEREVNLFTQDRIWHAIQAGRPPGVRIRALFAEDLSGPVLQMLGARYTIEPFFFSSSIGRIPSRFQSNHVPNGGDHITITLSFVRPVQNPRTVPPSPSSTYEGGQQGIPCLAQQAQDFSIDTQAPLRLRSSSLLLVHDLLALHMVRSHKRNSIISYHPGLEYRSTTAEGLKNRLHLAGRSVYWNNIFASTNDPTFVFICLLWYALYAWDEALEALYSHVCHLETQVMHSNDIGMTNELHLIRAHLLHYQALLQDFRRTVRFVMHTPNPCLDDPEQYSPELRNTSEAMMRKECELLIHEIDRLERQRDMQDMRLKNVMKLGFSIVNIEDSRRMQTLTEATVRDSAAMKQIAYLTMVFLPSSFVAGIFGMNITLLSEGVKGTLGHYFAVAVPLTILTIWIIVAYQIRIVGPRTRPATNDTSQLDGDGEGGGIFRFWRYTYRGSGQSRAQEERGEQVGIWTRLWWPMILASTILERRKSRKDQDAKRRT